MLQIISFRGGEEPRGSPHLACRTTEAGRPEGGGQGSCRGPATSVPEPGALPSAGCRAQVWQHARAAARPPAPCHRRVTAVPLQGPPASPSGFPQQPWSLHCSAAPSPRGQEAQRPPHGDGNAPPREPGRLTHLSAEAGTRQSGPEAGLCPWAAVGAGEALGAPSLGLVSDGNSNAGLGGTARGPGSTGRGGRWCPVCPGLSLSAPGRAGGLCEAVF